MVAQRSCTSLAPTEATTAIIPAQSLLPGLEKVQIRPDFTAKTTTVSFHTLFSFTILLPSFSILLLSTAYQTVAVPFDRTS